MRRESPEIPFFSRDAHFATSHRTQTRTTNDAGQMKRQEPKQGRLFT